MEIQGTTIPIDHHEFEENLNEFLDNLEQLGIGWRLDFYKNAFDGSNSNQYFIVVEIEESGEMDYTFNVAQLDDNIWVRSTPIRTLNTWREYFEVQLVIVSSIW